MVRKRTRGFTLLEVMIVCVIVGVLAAIVLPAYQDQMRKSRRASAQSHLMDIAAKEQAYFLDTRGSYSSSLSTLHITTPTDVSAYYTITVTPAAGPPPTFVANATATGSQVKDLGTGVDLTIDSTGAKLPAGKW
jgi:type IV pilus assembly protein PilE